MKNETLIEFIKEKYYEQKMSVDTNFNWQKLWNLKIKSPKIDQIIEFVIDFIKKI